DPVGIRSAEKQLTIVSSLSAILTIVPSGDSGNGPFAYVGKYCSLIAEATSGSSPKQTAYVSPIIPCNSVNSFTMPVTKSNLAISAPLLARRFIDSEPHH